MEIGNALSNNLAVLSVFRKEYYNESIFEVLRNLSDKRVCYVTLNKTATTLQNAFKMRGIDTSKIFFIDAVSRGIGNRAEQENVLKISSPAALTEISIAISESLKSQMFDALLFDSLSTLNVCGIDKRAERFISHTIGKLRYESKNGIFTCLEDDLSTNLIKSSYMHVDKVLKFNSFYDALEQKRHGMTFAALAVVVLVGALSFFNLDGGNQAIAYSVLDVVSSGSSLSSVLFLVFALISFFAYRFAVIRSIDPQILAKIKPTVENRENLKKRIKEKLHSWYDRIKHN